MVATDSQLSSCTVALGRHRRRSCNCTVVGVMGELLMLLRLTGHTRGPRKSSGHHLLEFVCENWMVQHITQVVRCWFNKVSSFIKLTITRVRNVMERRELKKPIGERDHAVIHMWLTLGSLTASDKCNRNISGINKSAMLGMSSWTLRREGRGDQIRENTASVK